MSALVLVENERTAGALFDHWQDVTGERYQFPNGYRNKVVQGRPFIYYRGVRRADGSRGQAEYFGCGVIGAVYLDPSNGVGTPKAQRKWLCEIDEYQPFSSPVAAKDSDGFIEKIPQNLFGVGVRSIAPELYARIVSKGAAPTLNQDPEVAAFSLPAMSGVSAVLADSLFVTPKHQDQDKKQTANGPGVRRSKFSAALGRRGEEVVLDYLQLSLPPAEAKTLRWTASLGLTPGWDIEYQSKGETIAIEVKATGGALFPFIEVSANEWSAARSKGPAYRLALVTLVRTTRPRIEFVENPFSLFELGALRAEASVWRVQRSV